MKIALVTDTHFGVRNDSPVFAKLFAKFYEQIFFPYIDEHKIDHIIHLGDIVDRRKFINYVTARRLELDLIRPITSRNMKAWFLVGNHDVYYKNTNEINSMRELYGSTNYDINIVDTPTEVNIDGCNILLMPWVCSSNYQECIKAMGESKSQVLFGHFEIKGFEMYKGAVNNDGFETNIFNKFDIVCSGHFHHKSTNGNINYLGAPYEMTWSDFDDPRGFHVFDTNTRELTFIQSPLNMFFKLWYNDSDWSDGVTEINNFDTIHYKDCFVKVIVKNKTNPYWFDLYIDKLEKAGISDIQVVEDHLNLDLESDEHIIDEAEDTITILKKYTDQLDIKVDRTRLDNLLSNLYNEALTIE